MDASRRIGVSMIGSVRRGKSMKSFPQEDAKPFEELCHQILGTITLTFKNCIGNKQKRNIYNLRYKIGGRGIWNMFIT